MTADAGPLVAAVAALTAILRESAQVRLASADYYASLLDVLEKKPSAEAARQLRATGNLTDIGLSATETAALRRAVEAADRYLRTGDGA